MMKHTFRMLRMRLALPLGILFFSLCVLMGMGCVDSAQATATTTTTSIVDPSCNAMAKGNEGFTVGLVYCVQTSIGKAVDKYVTALQTHLKMYEGMAAAVAIIMFGIKLMNSNVQYVIKESMGLGFRIAIGVFFFSQAQHLYDWIVGVPPNGSGIINEMVGWATGLTGSGGSGSGGGSNLFGNLISSNCSPVAPTYKYSGYQVWQAFDCMFTKIAGAANPSSNPTAFATSLLTIITVAIFSATQGVTIAFLGIGLIIGALRMVMRALFMVLMSYITIGFMVIFTPLIAPLLFFNSQYLTERFMAWAGIIVSSIIQPVFVIGFLAMAVVIDDQLIEGQLPGCSAPTYPKTTDTISNAPVQGFGQDGKGVCSFTQLMYNGMSGKSGGNGLATFFNSFMEMNTSLFSWTSALDPQSRSRQTGAVVNPQTGNPGTTNTTGASAYTGGMCGNTACLADSVGGQNAANYTMSTPHFKTYAPLRQIMLTLLTFIFVNFCMRKLLDIIPEIAKNMSISMGTSLYGSISVPFENTLQSVTGGLRNAGMDASKGKGVLPAAWQAAKTTVSRPN